MIDHTAGASGPSDRLTSIRRLGPPIEAVAVVAALTDPALPIETLLQRDSPLVVTLRRLRDALDLSSRDARDRRSRDERLREIVDVLSEGVVILTLDGLVLAASRDALRIFGSAQSGHFVGRDFRGWLKAAHGPALTALLHRVGAGSSEPLLVQVETIHDQALTLILEPVAADRSAVPTGRAAVPASAPADGRTHPEIAFLPESQGGVALQQSRAEAQHLRAELALAHAEAERTRAAQDADRTAWEARLLEAEGRVEHLQRQLAADRQAWASMSDEIEVRLADHGGLRRERDRLAQAVDQLRRDQGTVEEQLAAERLAHRIVREEAETLRAMLEQEQRKRADAERRQGLLQDAYGRAAAERDRVIESNLMGYAVMTITGEVVRCNDAFARLFGYVDAPEVLTVTAGRPFPMLTGRDALDARLTESGQISCVQSVVDRLDGRPVRLLESATVLPEAPDGVRLVERVFIDTSAGGVEDLRSRRLGEVGALALSMGPELESLTLALVQEARAMRQVSETPLMLSQDLHTLVRQLAAFGRKQTHPVDAVALDDLVSEARTAIEKVLGDFLDCTFQLESNAVLGGTRGDIEHLVFALAALARDILPLGGTVVIGTHQPVRPSGTRDAGAGPVLSVIARGHGALPVVDAPAATLAARRCDASLHIEAVSGGIRLDVQFARTR